jgi:sporulation protein YlmC with PRC-barrel domain
MTDNLVSAISRFLTPDLIGKMASVSGLDRGTTQSAVGACVPAILSSLADLAAKPGGARQLGEVIAEQPSGMLSNLAQTLGTGTLSAEKGSGMLSSLLGGGVLSTLVSTLSRFVGIGEGSTRTLMGLLAPVVLGVLGREQRAAGLETGGLARLLMGQKDQISAAMPVGLSDLLSSRVRMEGSADTVRETSRPETRTYTEGGSRGTYAEGSRSFEEGRRYEPEREAQRTTTPTPPPRRPVEARDTGTDWSWAYWALPLLALGGLLWYLLPDSQTGVDRTATAPTQQSAPGTQTGTPPGGGTSTAPGRVTYLSKAEPGWTPVGMYYQQDIFNKSGEKIGTVKDLLVGPEGRIHAAVLSVGRFLGLGDRDIAVPLNSIEVDRAGNRIVIDVAKETLQSAPPFEHGAAIRLK